jgi:hypothetical protein
MKIAELLMRIVLAADAPPPAPPAPPPVDEGDRDVQLQAGIPYQTPPDQAGVVVQGAYQGKNWQSGRTYHYLNNHLHLQSGYLQPTATLQLTHLWAYGAPPPSYLLPPLPPPDTAQISGTISPLALTIGDPNKRRLTLTLPIGIAASVAGDIFGQTNGPGASGMHGQLLGVFGVQADYVFAPHWSITVTGGGQAGVDISSGGANGVVNGVGSFLFTYHFCNQFKNN